MKNVLPMDFAPFLAEDGMKKRAVAEYRLCLLYTSLSVIPAGKCKTGADLRIRRKVVVR